MAQTTRSRSRYADFPILFEDRTTLVYTNGSGEIFIENKRGKNSTIRITPDQDGFSVTAYGSQLTPWAIRGLSAILVQPGR